MCTVYRHLLTGSMLVDTALLYCTVRLLLLLETSLVHGTVQHLRHVFAVAASVQASDATTHGKINNAEVSYRELNVPYTSTFLLAQNGPFLEKRLQYDGDSNRLIFSSFLQSHVIL